MCKRIFNFYIFLFCFFYSLSCLIFNSYSDSFFNVSRKENILNADEYYLDGIYYYSKRHYESSGDSFEQLSKNYPYSRYTRNALILEAFVDYINKKYENIEGIFAVYNNLFFKDEYEDYMMYLRAMCYYKQIKDVHMNTLFVDSSLLYFNQLVEKYPNSKFSIDAKKKIDFLMSVKQLAEIYNGEFYQSIDSYISAMRRYTGILEKYKEVIVPELEERVLCRIIEVSKSFEMEYFYNDYVNLLKKKYPDSNCQY